MSKVQPARFASRTQGNRTWRGPAVILLLALLILVVPGWHVPSDEHLHLPSGYTDLVKALISEGYLASRDDGESYRLETSRLSDGSPLLKTISDFNHNSFLGEDLGPGAHVTWTRDGIDPSAHRESGPSDDVIQWHGDLQFTTLDRVVDPAAVDPGPVLELIDLDAGHANWLIKPRLGRASEAGDPRIDLLAAVRRDPDAARAGGGGGTVIADNGLVVLSTPNSDSEVDLLLVGDQPLLRLIADPPGRMWVDGQPIDGKPAQHGQERLVPLMEKGLGDARRPAVDLTILPAGGRSRHFRLIQHESLISSYRRTGALVASNDGTMVTTRNYYPDLESFARPIESRLPMNSPSLPITLVEELQSVSQTALRTHAKDVLDRNGDAAFSFRASATLMDGMTGEIVALPTWPARQADLLALDKEKLGARRLFERNNNFVTQPIGSTAKLPFAVSIAQRFPDLLGLRISSNVKKFYCFMGWPKRKHTDEHGMGENLDFPHFIARSSNRYAMSLMMLGLVEPVANQPFLKRQADWKPVCRAAFPDDDRFSMSQAWVDPNPPYALHLGAPTRFDAHPPYGRLLKDGSGEWDRGFPLKQGHAGDLWSANLSELFCVRAQQNSHPGAGCSPDLWAKGSPLEGRNVATIDQVDLKFWAVKDLYSDYLMNVIGGSRSLWTTIQLAQAYARLVSGLAIQPTLSPRDPHAPVAPASLPFKPEVRKAALGGMTHVFDGSPSWDGTAKSLPDYKDAKTLPDRSTLIFYGKTGTPTVTPYTGASEGAKALHGFLLNKCGLRGVARAGGGARLYVGQPNRPTPDAIEDLRNKPGPCAVYADPAKATLVAEEIRAINASPLASLVRLSPDGFAAYVPPRPDRDRLDDIGNKEPAGRLFVFVAARYPEGHFDRPCSVSVIASNYQSKASGSPALSFTKDLLATPQIKRWLGRAQNGCGKVNP